MRAKVVTAMRWYVQDEVNQEESGQNEVDGVKKGADSKGKVMHMWKSGWWFVVMKWNESMQLEKFAFAWQLKVPKLTIGFNGLMWLSISVAPRPSVRPSVRPLPQFYWNRKVVQTSNSAKIQRWSGVTREANLRSNGQRSTSLGSTKM